MKGKMLILKTDDTIEVVDLIEPPPLSLLQKSVGGYIEAVPYFDMFYGGVDDEPDERPCVAFCNEEGKLNGLPVNRQATLEWRCCLIKQGLQPSDILVGDVVVITGDKALLGRL